MAEATTQPRKWRMRLYFVLLVFAALFVLLLPLQTLPQAWAGPDWIVVLTVVWALRRPEFVPALSVAATSLLADFILLRPPGVLAAIMVVARQVLKHQEPGLRDSTFAMEWLTAAAAFTGIMMANRLFLSIFLVDQPSLGLSIMQLVMNIFAYPLIVVFSRLAFGLRKIVPGETDAMAGVA